MISASLSAQVHNCIRCGLCMNACPVYRQVRYEGASPRGKIQLIKKVLEGELDPSANFYRLLGTCLLCETCTVHCPSGVQLDRLMKAMRAELLGRFRLSWEKKTVVHLLSGRRLLPFCMFWGRILENPLRNLLPRQGRAGTIPYPRLPRLNAAPLLGQYPERVPARVPRTGRVLYFAGCATNYLYETVGHAVIGLLERLGIEVLLPKGLMCCGFPVFLAGARQAALKNIRRNIQIMQAQEVDAIVVDCATCGSALKKEYANILEEMGEDGTAARRIGQKVLDISQYLSRFDLKPLLSPIEERVTYHDPCHLLRGQGVKEEPRSLLKGIPGVEFVEMAGADTCCGGGGTFQLEHPQIASGITADKIRAIRASGAGLVATGCPGCRLQIHGHLGGQAIRVLHPVELLARSVWGCGGARDSAP